MRGQGVGDGSGSVRSEIQEIKAVLAARLPAHESRGEVLHVQLEGDGLGGIQNAAEVQLRSFHVGVVEQVRPGIALLVGLARSDIIGIGRAIDFDQRVGERQFLLCQRGPEVEQ